MAFEDVTLGSRSTRAWFESSILEFITADKRILLGILADRSEFSLEASQKDAWKAEFDLLQRELAGLEGQIYFEYSIPRMGRRIDVVVVSGPVVFVIEFKVGSQLFDTSAIDQVWDYALDLKNFHKASHGLAIVPILVATEAYLVPPSELAVDADEVYRPVLSGPDSLRAVMDRVQAKIAGAVIDAATWGVAPYHPTPTIVVSVSSVVDGEESRLFDGNRTRAGAMFTQTGLDEAMGS